MLETLFNSDVDCFYTFSVQLETFLSSSQNKLSKLLICDKASLFSVMILKPFQEA